MNHKNQDKTIMPQSVTIYESMLSEGRNIYFDVEELVAIVRFYIFNNKLQEAMSVCEFGITIHPLSSVLQTKKAQVLIEMQKFDEAIEILSAVSKIDTNDVEINTLFATALVRIRRGNEAVALFDKIISQMEFSGELYDLNYEIARIYMQNSEYGLACRYLEHAYAENKTNYSLIYDYGFALERINEDKKSIELLRIYLEEYPFTKLAWYNLGIVYQKLEDYDKAIEAYDFCIAIDETFASAYYNKAVILYHAEKIPAALDVFIELSELEPYSYIVTCYIADCYEDLREYKEAEKYYNMTLDINPKKADAIYGLAKILLMKAKFKASEKKLEQAIEIEGTNPLYWFALARVQNEQQKIEKADYSYQQAIKYAPFNVYCWLDYSELKFYNNEFSTAIELLNNAKSYIPDNAIIDYRLAAYHFRSGKKRTAVKYLSDALKRDYDSHIDFLNFCPSAKIDKRIKKIIESFN